MAHWLAREAGISLSEAIATVDTAARLPECPATETALRAGKLSRVQVNEVTAAAVVDPASETRLVAEGAARHLQGPQGAQRPVKAAVRDDTTEHLRIRAIRNVSTWRDGDGAHLHLQSTPKTSTPSCKAWRPTARRSSTPPARVRTAKRRARTTPTRWSRWPATPSTAPAPFPARSHARRARC